MTHVVGPDGNPINVLGIPGCAPANTAAGDYTCLTGRPINTILPFLEQINAAVQAAYGSLTNYDPNGSPSEFESTNGVTFGGQFPGDYKIPYSMQFNIGVQRELLKGHVLAVDYVRQRGVGLPLQLADYEARRDARFFNEAAVRASIATRIGVTPAQVNPATIQAFINSRPAGSTSISTFALANDTNFPGKSDLTRARLVVGGFSLYQGLQVSLNGRFAEDNLSFLSIGDRSLIKGLTYTVGYALSGNQTTGGGGRPEFIANTIDNNDYNSKFGPSALDRRHNLTVSVSSDLIGGFRLDQIYRAASSAPQTLFIPNNRGTSGIFTSDFNGDGGTGTTPRGDVLPGTGIGDFGRRISSLNQLNAVLANYNSTFAGQITPAGQRLISAGLFTRDQLVALGATLPEIPLVPEGNPDPFENLFNADFRLTRPIRLWKESWILEPSISVFNVFNYSARGQYAGLAIPNVGSSTVTNFGSLNYNYDTAEELAALDEFRSLRSRRRQLQFGIRFSF